MNFIINPINQYLSFLLLFFSFVALAQDQNIIDQIVQEANKHSQLEQLGQELMDGIGPRLVGTPQMKQAHDWAVNTYAKWGHSCTQ